MEDGLRGPDQRAQTTARAKPQPLSGRGRDGTVGRIRSGRRHAHQCGNSFGKPEEWIKVRRPLDEKETPSGDGKARGSAMHTRARPLIYPAATLEPIETSFLRRKVASFRQVSRQNGTQIQKSLEERQWLSRRKWLRRPIVVMFACGHLKLSVDTRKLHGWAAMLSCPLPSRG